MFRVRGRERMTEKERGEGERQTDRDRHRHKQTDRQTDRGGNRDRPILLLENKMLSYCTQNFISLDKLTGKSL